MYSIYLIVFAYRVYYNLKQILGIQAFSKTTVEKGKGVGEYLAGMGKGGTP
jgi:hypothetical protein